MKRKGSAKPTGLTRKQIAVLKAIGDGLGTKEIARQMKMSNKAVEWNVGKLNVIFKSWHNRVKLARIAIAFGLSSLCLVCMAAAAQTQPTLTFGWNVPTDQNWTNLTYRLYYTTTVTTPTNQWPLLKVFTNVVQVGTKLYSTNTLPLAPGNYFFTLTASNTWYGVPVESFFSLAATNVPPPPVLNNLLLLPPQ